MKLRSRKDNFYITPPLTERTLIKKVINCKVNKDYDSVPFGGGLLQALKEKKQTFILSFTAQRMKFSIKGFFCKCDQTRGFLWI